MPLFGRRTRDLSAPASRARPGIGGPRDEDGDWRSFDSAAEDYARVVAPHFEAVATDLVGLLEARTGQRVLDIGTGTGVAARAAAAAVGPAGCALGVDPSVGMLRAASREGGGPRYAASTSIDLPFRDGAFDHLVANFVIGFFPSYQTAFFELLRVLKAGGRMAVSWWGPGDDADDLGEAWRSVAEEFAELEMLQDARARVVPWQERFADRAVLKDTLHEAGLRDIRTEARRYRFAMSRDDWLAGQEAASLGRFLRHMLGEELWETFRRRAREAFAERFPDRLNDFRDVVLVVGHKP